MLRRERIIKRFILGISVLTSYISYTGSLNMHDINIIAERFMCDLLNILYGAELTNANDIVRNNSGYDLISKSKKIIVQVSSSDTPEKIANTIEIIEKKVFEYWQWKCRLEDIRKQREINPSSYTSNVYENEEKLKAKMKEEVDLKGYNLYIMTLRQEASKQKRYMGSNGKGYLHTEDIKFEKNNILDFSTLINKVNSISEFAKGSEKDLLAELDKFMDKNIGIFGTDGKNIDKVSNNKVDSIIREYADNFTDRLFRHRYIMGSQVTLNRLFVNPKIYSENIWTDDFIEVLDKFLWDEVKNRILFIEGDAAIGKTSLVSYLCYHYLQNDDIGKAVFLSRPMVCVRLRELDFSDANKNIREILLDYLGFSTMEEFKRLFDNCTLILDGADEMSMIEGMHTTGMEELIVSIRKIFNNNKIIITSRPQFINISKFATRNFGVRSVEMLHFDQEMRKQWLHNYETCGEVVPERTRDYIMNIDNKTASGVADTPLALYLLAACDIREELQGNVWALYHEIFHNAIINTEYNENFNNNLEHPIKNYEEILYDIVCKIAFKMFENSIKERYYITSKELDEIIKIADVDASIVAWIRRCCVLCAYWKSNGKTGVLEFYHNNIRDYFLCEYIYDKLEQLVYIKPDERLRYFLRTMCKIMQFGYISGTTWEQTFLFLHQKLQYIAIRNDSFLIEIEELLEKIYEKNIVVDGSIWTYNYGGCNYQRIKHTFFNTLLLLRVLQIGAGTDYHSAKKIFYNTEEQYNEIVNSNILKDWCDMFKHQITLSDETVIAIGQNCILDGLNFENIVMQNARFERSSFKNTRFSNTKLEKIDFSNGIFENTDFSGAVLENLKFTNTRLENVDFSNSVLRECDFTDGDIIGGKFDSTKFIECKFRNETVEGVNWKVAKIQNCYLTNSKFTNSFFYKIKLRNQDLVKLEFINCELASVDVINCTLKEWIFEDCVLDKMGLSNAKLYNLKVLDTICKEANCNKAFISGNEFKNVNFENTSFAQAAINKNTWKNIKLHNCDFRSTLIYVDDYALLKKYNVNLQWAVEKKGELHELNV